MSPYSTPHEGQLTANARALCRAEKSKYQNECDVRHHDNRDTEHELGPLVSRINELAHEIEEILEDEDANVALSALMNAVMFLMFDHSVRPYEDAAHIAQAFQAAVRQNFEPGWRDQSVGHDDVPVTAIKAGDSRAKPKGRQT
jgi:hypothetical protein